MPKFHYADNHIVDENLLKLYQKAYKDNNSSTATDKKIPNLFNTKSNPNSNSNSKWLSAFQSLLSNINTLYLLTKKLANLPEFEGNHINVGEIGIDPDDPDYDANNLSSIEKKLKEKHPDIHKKVVELHKIIRHYENEIINDENQLNDLLKIKFNLETKIHNAIEFIKRATNDKQDLQQLIDTFGWNYSEAEINEINDKINRINFTIADQEKKIRNNEIKLQGNNHQIKNQKVEKEDHINELKTNIKQLEELIKEIYQNYHYYPAQITQSEEYSVLKNSIVKFNELIKSMQDELDTLHENFEHIDGRLIYKYKNELLKINDIEKILEKLAYFNNDKNVPRFSAYSFKSFSRNFGSYIPDPLKTAEENEKLKQKFEEKKKNIFETNLSRADKLNSNLLKMIDSVQKIISNIQELFDSTQKLHGSSRKSFLHNYSHSDWVAKKEPMKLYYQ